MSLICDETGRAIEHGAVLMAGTRDDVEFFSALSQEVLERIPETLMCPTPCEPSKGGMNIHEAMASRNLTGNYSTSDFRLKGFCFSVSDETAQTYLPKHATRYPAPMLRVQR